MAKPEYNTYMLDAQLEADTMNTLTLKSVNAKTGDCYQVGHLVGSVKPTIALKLGLDKAICGACPLQGIRDKITGKRTARKCYPVLFRINAIWQAAKSRRWRGPLPIDKIGRIGMYGDPALTMSLRTVASWARRLRQNGKRLLGYTHQWADGISPKWAKYCMASLDDQTATRLGLTIVQLKQLAHKMGYRTYRIIRSKDELLADEILCPFVKGGKLTCSTCRLCCGMQIKAKNIAVLEI